MANIYLIRHGQASFGSNNYDALSNLGIRQSKMTGQCLVQRGIQFDHVVTGSLKRHQQTAEHCLEAMGYQGKQTTDARFNEYDHEQVLAVSRPEFADRERTAAFLAQSDNPRKTFQLALQAAIERWMTGQHDSDYTETWQQFKTRCHEALAHWVENAGDIRNLAIFTSGGPISLALQYVLNIPDQQAVALSWSTHNAAITRLIHNRKRVSLSFFNDYSHFETNDPSTLTQR